jgi:hypothetical protein
MAASTTQSTPIAPSSEGHHFLPLPRDSVILLVAMRSPMYFWRNLLLLSSLSCSSLTASIRLRIVKRESCSCFACLCGVSSMPGLKSSCREAL